MNIEDLKDVILMGDWKKVAEITMLCNSCIASWKNDGKLKYQHFLWKKYKKYPFSRSNAKEIAPFLYRKYSANYSHRCSWNLIFESVNSNEFATHNALVDMFVRRVCIKIGYRTTEKCLKIPLFYLTNEEIQSRKIQNNLYFFFIFMLSCMLNKRARQGFQKKILSFSTPFLHMPWCLLFEYLFMHM